MRGTRGLDMYLNLINNRGILFQSKYGPIAGIREPTNKIYVSDIIYGNSCWKTYLW